MKRTSITAAAVFVGALAFTVPAFADRHEHSRGGGADRRSAAPAPRSYAAPRPYASPRGYAGPRTEWRGTRVAPYGRGPSAYVVGPRFYRPYYSFRPRLSLGFGLWVGYPVVYPYAYEPYPYSYGSVEAQPGYAPIESGISFEITPPTAAVYVDGQYAGTAADFGPMAPPLSLTPGRHHIEIVSPGYRTIGFDTDAIAGQIIPYRGAMEPDRY